MIKIEMISTGEEVLSGQITDTNAAWFSNIMMNHGIELQMRTTIGDRMEDLVNTFRERSLHADLILVNGGLGPTSDDLSAEALSLALQEPLVENTQWREHLEQWFSHRGREMPASNIKQCLIPESAILVDNPVGSAPGFRARLNNAWLFFTPGVPVEFKTMIEDQFIPFMQAEFGGDEVTRLHKFLTLGHGESGLADSLGKINLPDGITLGFRPSPPHVEVKVFARGQEALGQFDQLLVKTRRVLGNAIVAEGPPSIAEAVHKLLVDSDKTLSIAESCTGGLLTSQLIEYSGSSAYLLEGLVTYSNAAKVKHLGVAPATLDQHGAVSMQTARAMAEGVRRSLDSDYGLATTGIAGPDGGTETRPVGTVVIALADRQHTWVQAIQLSRRSRQLVRVMSTAVALDMLRRRLLDQDPVVEYPFIPCTESEYIDASAAD